ncbi:Multiple antibiotic resistance protein MarR [Shimia sp. SK013]|uniref:MarR family winged helix-turn-helix transcriptional regulator n=1 Tax=Shimia sp. SK013 TaxID=1389006 RepID=UPI0006B42BEA|nr:MarR family transcriptional regulator [Shimia sp. SK013]KPA22976.1 Multiple antibiotic resistance protein MarR [Shimia sp. SK013]
MAASDNDTRVPDVPVAARIVPALFRSRNIIWDNDHRIVEAHGVTWSQFVTLISLQSAGPELVLSPTQLYSAVQVSSGGLTKMLTGLEKDGYVDRVPNPQDKRSRLVKLTPTGDRKARGISKELLAANQTLIGGILTDAETEQLAALLRKLLIGLQQSPLS